MKAIFNGQVVAESTSTKILEGNHYFPPESIEQKYFRPSDQTTVCFWKGTAHYYDVVVEGKTAEAAAWYYPEVSKKADAIRGYVAFWKGVQVVP